MMNKFQLLVVSHVFPFSRKSGQQQRVYYKLKALSEYFHITFLSIAPQDRIPRIEKKLAELCDEAVVLPSRYTQNIFSKTWYRLKGTIYTLTTGLKFSNYLLGDVELSPGRIVKATQNHHFDLVLYEYWHTVDSVSVFHKDGIPTVLDMHNLLWQSLKRQLDDTKCMPAWWKHWAVEQYKEREEQAWTRYDYLIAINKGECEYAQKSVPDHTQVLYAPMGTDLSLWPYTWQPAKPIRLAYYGGLGGAHNQRDAMLCYRKIMPRIWDEFPHAELWLIGSNPPDDFYALSKQDKRVFVTGYVPQVQEVLKTISVVLCPWSGTYGFRSRLVEVMALGVPVVSTPQAVFGMDMTEGEGIFFAETPPDMAQSSLNLLRDTELLKEQSLLARKQIEEKYSYKATYQCLAEELFKITKHHSSQE
jgi:glycosyltransferase involved in cell wall biosynthesis